MEYDVLQNRTEPDDAITSALDDFWEEIDTLDERTLMESRFETHRSSI